jgi:hypothetical protein
VTNFFFAVRFDFFDFFSFFFFNFVNFILNGFGEIDNFNITILEISDGFHPINGFFFRVEAESFKGSVLGFINIDPGFDVSIIFVSISGHNLETVSFSPSFGSHVRSDLGNADSFDQTVNVGIFENTKSLFI